MVTPLNDHSFNDRTHHRSITDAMIGHKLGEFSPTRTFRGHIKGEDRKATRA